MQSRANRNPATRYQRRASLRIAENQDLRRPQGEPHFLGCCGMVDVCEDLDVFLIQPKFQSSDCLVCPVCTTHRHETAVGCNVTRILDQLLDERFDATVLATHLLNLDTAQASSSDRADR
jgi:hypothetical protein